MTVRPGIVFHPGSLPETLSGTGHHRGIYLLLKQAQQCNYSLIAVPTGIEDPLWTGIQLARLEQHPAFRVLKPATYRETGQYSGIAPMIVEKPWLLTADSLNLGFADRVREAYPELLRVCRELDIQDVPKLQVGINTFDLALFALMFSFWRQQNFLPFVQRTAQEVAEIQKISNGNVMFVIESPCATILGSLLPFGFVRRWIARRLLQVIDTLPQDAAFGVHMCYGDLDNNALLDQSRLTRALHLYRLVYRHERTAKIANTLLDTFQKHGRTPEFVHIPYCWGNRPPSPRLPLRTTWLRKLIKRTQVFIGAIHDQATIEDQRRLYTKLHQKLGNVGVATSCGCGRISDEQTYARLNRIRAAAGQE